MSNSNETVDLSGVFLMLLTLILVAGKVSGQVAFSWIWVFAPLWLPLAVLFIIWGVVMLCLGFLLVSCALYDKFSE